MNRCNFKLQNLDTQRKLRSVGKSNCRYWNISTTISSGNSGSGASKSEIQIDSCFKYFGEVLLFNRRCRKLTILIDVIPSGCSIVFVVRKFTIICLTLSTFSSTHNKNTLNWPSSDRNYRRTLKGYTRAAKLGTICAVEIRTVNGNEISLNFCRRPHLEQMIPDLQLMRTITT